MRAMLRAYDRIVEGMASIAGVMLTLMAFWVTYEVGARYIFNAPTIWAVDLSEYTLLYATFLGAPWLVRSNGHVRIEVVLERLPESVQQVLVAILALVCAACCAVMVYLGVGDVAEAWRRTQLMPGLLQMPRWIVVACIPVGSFFLVTEFLRYAVLTLRGQGYHATAVQEVEWEPVV